MRLEARAEKRGLADTGMIVRVPAVCDTETPQPIQCPWARTRAAAERTKHAQRARMATGACPTMQDGHKAQSYKRPLAVAFGDADTVAERAPSYQRRALGDMTNLVQLHSRARPNGLTDGRKHMELQRRGEPFLHMLTWAQGA